MTEEEKLLITFVKARTYRNYTGETLCRYYYDDNVKSQLPSLVATKEEAMTCSLPDPEPKVTLIVPEERIIDPNRTDVFHPKDVFDEVGHGVFIFREPVALYQVKTICLETRRQKCILVIPERLFMQVPEKQ